MDEEALAHELAGADNEECRGREEHAYQDILDHEASEELARVERTVRIPASPYHEGRYAMTAILLWVCPACGGPRGEPFPSHSYDGSRRLHVHGWHNPCGHVDKYSEVLKEALARRTCVPA